MALKKLTFEVIKNSGLYKTATKFAGRTALGAASGGAAGAIISPSGYKEEGAKQGLGVGAAVGVLSNVPAGKIAGKALQDGLRSGYGAALKLGKKAGRNPVELESILTRASVNTLRKGRVVFRRIRGRIIPVKVK